jgi:TRAP-type C4-dicarboxylate transport system permease small subunit
MIDKIPETISRVSLLLAGLCIAVMAIMTVADIVMRYLFLSPLPGTSEHTQILMAVIVFSGLVLVTREGTHIVVSLFEGPLNRIAPGLFGRVYFASNVIGLGFITYAMALVTRDMYEFEEETLVMSYPLVYLGGFVVLLLVLCMLQLAHLAKSGPSGHDVE